MRVTLDGNAESTPKPQICYLQALCLIIHKQILRFEISVHHTMLVTMRSPFDELVHEALQQISFDQLLHCEERSLVTSFAVMNT